MFYLKQFTNIENLESEDERNNKPWKIYASDITKVHSRNEYDFQEYKKEVFKFIYYCDKKKLEKNIKSYEASGKFGKNIFKKR